MEYILNGLLIGSEYEAVGEPTSDTELFIVYWHFLYISCDVRVVYTVRYKCTNVSGPSFCPHMIIEVA